MVVDFSRVFHDASDAIVIEDVQGRVLELNRAAVEAYGWQPEELVGQPIKKIIPEERYQHADELLHACLSGELVRDVRGTRVGRNGRRYEVLLTLSPILDEQGQVAAVASYAKDITELLRAEAERERAQEASFSLDLDAAGVVARQLQIPDMRLPRA